MAKSTTRNKKKGYDRDHSQERNLLSHLHVVVPEAARRRAKVAAAKSGIPFKLYMAKLLMMAEPIGELAAGVPTEPCTHAAENTAQQEKQDE